MNLASRMLLVVFSPLVFAMFVSLARPESSALSLVVALALMPLLLVASLRYWVLRPLGRVRTVLQSAAAGDRLLRLDVTGSREFDDLSASFNAMVEARDAGQERAAQRSLAEAEARQRSLFDISPAGIFMLDAAGKITICNRRLADMLGYSSEELIGSDYLELVLPDYRPAAIRSMGGTLQGGVDDFYSGEREYLRKDRSVLHCLLAARRLPPVEGASDVLLVSVTDISEIKRAEAEREESAARFSAFFHFSPVAMGIAAAAEPFAGLEFNEAWYRTFGRGTEVLGKSGVAYDLWVAPETRAPFMERVRDEGECVGYEVSLRRSDGAILTVIMSGRRVDAGGRPVLLLSYFDVTEQRRIQTEISELNTQLELRVAERTAELQASNSELSQAVDSLRLAQDELVNAERLAALGSLVAGVAHELNTPIGNGLTVASTLEHRLQEFTESLAVGLRRSVLDRFIADSRMAAEILTHNLTRASELILSFKQVAVDQTSSQRRRFILHELVGEILLTLNPAIRKSGCRMSVSIAEGLAFDSYPGPLGQVLTNLVNNAMIHGFEDRPPGLIEISAVGGAGEDGDLVELRIRDEGRGIEQHNLKRIFDPFFTTRFGQGGSGLGLHIVHNIVTGVLGGQLELSSTPGEGTCFTLRLPPCAPVVENASKEQ